MVKEDWKKTPKPKIKQKIENLHDELYQLEKKTRKICQTWC